MLDPHGVSEADVGAVAAHLEPAAVVLLVEALAFFDGASAGRRMVVPYAVVVVSCPALKRHIT